jgi:hypothetical protein
MHSRTHNYVLSGLALLAAAIPTRAQANWTQATGQLSGGRHYGAAAFDASRGKVLVFGGQDSTSVVHNDTAEWNGTSWVNLGKVGAPSPRCFLGYVWDSGRNRIVLYGGLDPAVAHPVDDTWEWQNGTWTKINIKGPGGGTIANYGRQMFGMAYDAARQQTILFGGYVDRQNVFDETWAYNGSSWTLLNPATKPVQRFDMALCYDANRQRIVMYGGSDKTGVSLNDTWEWDGTNWTQIATGAQPVARYRYGFVYDSARKKVVLYGGAPFPTAAFSDTWEYDGVTWSVSPVVSPPAREGLQMAFDGARNKVVLVGGHNGMADTWERTHSYWFVGEGHAGGGLPMTASGVPGVGQTFTLSFPAFIGVSWLTLGAGPCLAAPVSIGNPPFCQQANVWHIPVIAIQASGFNPSYPLAIPNVPAFVGQLVSTQGVAMQGGNCLMLTDGMQIEITP